MKIPEKVNILLKKLNDITSEESKLAANIFQMALTYRKAIDVSDELEEWEKYGKTKWQYPEGKKTRAFVKYLTSCLLAPPMNNLFNNEEVMILCRFFAKVPTDFKLDDRSVCANCELKDVIS